MIISHLILSAGESSRMGRPKGLLRWKDKTFLEHATQAAKESGAKEIIVVLGAHFQEMKLEASRLKITTAQNNQWNLGMGSSLRYGMKSAIEAIPDIDGILIQLLDQPLVTGTHLGNLKSFFDQDKIVVSKYHDSFGPPVLFPKKYFKALLDIPNHSGAKRLIASYLVDTIFMNLSEAAFDIDTQEQFNNLPQCP